MSGDKQVFAAPAPTTHVVNVTAAGVDMVAWFWVKNADWFSARTESVVEACGGV